MSKTIKVKKTISQLEIAQEIAQELGLTIATVQKVIESQQKKIMDAVANGKSVVMKNFITLKTRVIPEKKFKSGLTQKDETIPSHKIVRATIGEGFKSYINNNSMKSKLCRYVDKNNKKSN